MANAKQGDTLTVHYTGRLEDGTVFDTSEDREPLEFTLGEEQVIPGFEDAVEGLEEGETTTAEISSENAYGERREDLVLSVPKEQLPENIAPEVGQQLQMRTKEGENFQVVITDVEADTIQVDANHPLAGNDLTFDIELLEID